MDGSQDVNPSMDSRISALQTVPQSSAGIRYHESPRHRTTWEISTILETAQRGTVTCPRPHSGRAGAKTQVSRLSSQLWAQLGPWGLSPELGGRAAPALKLDGEAQDGREEGGEQVPCNQPQ